MSYEIIIKQWGKEVARIVQKDKKEADDSKLRADNSLKSHRLGKSMGFTVETKKKEQIITP